MDPSTAQASDLIRAKLKLKGLESRNSFSQKHNAAHSFLASKGISLGNLRAHSAKLLNVGMVSGALLLAQPSTIAYLPRTAVEMNKMLPEATPTPPMSSFGKLMEGLHSVLPVKPRPLERSEEKSLEVLFKSTLGVDAKATLEGEHLNTTYGLIGAEQHLRRYPGDKIGNHDLTPLDEGMAPGLGAWGYFAPTKEKLTPDLVDSEKWYAVAQTLYLPDWNTRTRYLRDWYKYRKVLIVNTQNGKAVVADIADSGPAAFTGKQFGGSPEVMNYLGGDGLDRVLVNDSHLPEEVVAAYDREGVRPLTCSPEEVASIEAMGPRVVVEDFVERAPKRDLWQKQDSLRHSPRRVAQALVSLLGDRE